MGVGFLIGNNSNNNNNFKAAAVTPQIITVNGGAAAPTSTASNARGSKKPVKAAKVKITTKVEKAATAAANQALGGGAQNLVNNATVQPGQSCSGGAGCQNGKFTGNFFGP